MQRTRFLAPLVLSAALLVAAVPASAKTLTVYPHQLKDWATTPATAFTLGANGISASSAEFMCPVKLPVGATVTQFRVWSNSPDGGGWARLIRVKDGEAYASPANDLAGMGLNSGTWFQWDLLVDSTIGPAPAKIAAGHRYFLYVRVISEEVGTIMIDYKAP